MAHFILLLFKYPLSLSLSNFFIYDVGHLPLQVLMNSSFQVNVKL